MCFKPCVYFSRFNKIDRTSESFKNTHVAKKVVSSIAYKKVVIKLKPKFDTHFSIVSACNAILRFSPNQ